MAAPAASSRALANPAARAISATAPITIQTTFPSSLVRLTDSCLTSSNAIARTARDLSDSLISSESMATNGPLSISPLLSSTITVSPGRMLGEVFETVRTDAQPCSNIAAATAHATKVFGLAAFSAEYPIAPNLTFEPSFLYKVYDPLCKGLSLTVPSDTVCAYLAYCFANSAEILISPFIRRFTSPFSCHIRRKKVSIRLAFSAYSR